MGRMSKLKLVVGCVKTKEECLIKMFGWLIK
jgi:hypothetical protein